MATTDSRAVEKAAGEKLPGGEAERPTEIPP
jgi:hypothetical protein